jgi:hypothetical protein
VIGDDRAWKNIEKDILPGAEYAVVVNKTLLFKGRVEANEVPGDASGVKIEIVLRTKLADARYASADPSIKVSHTTIKDFILALFAQHGYAEGDFYFSSSAGTDLLTGAPQGREGESEPRRDDPPAGDGAAARDRARVRDATPPAAWTHDVGRPRRQDLHRPAE